jgi:hypothetical protein
MKRMLKFLVLFVLVAAGVNAIIESQRECGCDEDCWCKNPVLTNFRWIIPAGHKGPWSREEA